MNKKVFAHYKRLYIYIYIFNMYIYIYIYIYIFNMYIYIYIYIYLIYIYIYIYIYILYIYIIFIKYWKVRLLTLYFPMVDLGRYIHFKIIQNILKIHFKDMNL